MNENYYSNLDLKTILRSFFLTDEMFAYPFGFKGFVHVVGQNPYEILAVKMNKADSSNRNIFAKIDILNEMKEFNTIFHRSLERFPTTN
jgi:hypothetical protein